MKNFTCDKCKIEIENSQLETESKVLTYNYLADTLPQIVWSANPDGLLDWYNKQWFDYTGLTLEETQGWGWSAALHPDDIDKTVKMWTACVETGDEYQMEYRFKRSCDGEYRWHLGRALPIRDSSGKIIKWFGTGIDIHDYKKTETAFLEIKEDLELKILNRTQELERSNHELEQFAYSASHDLQEPLRMVSSYCGLIKKKYSHCLDEDGMEFIEYAVDGAGRMKHLIESLLEYARVGKTGDMTILPTNEVVESVIQNLSKSITDASAEIKVENLLDVNVTQASLSPIFQNLISNAIKFKDKNRKSHITISSKRIDNCVEFAVKDNGIGIDQRYIHKLFVIFQRLHTKEEYAGTGIGLAICKKIVDNYKGEIWVSSKLGEGTTFYFTLPIKKD